MALVVQKFGGTCIPDTGRIDTIAAEIARRRAGGDQIVVTVSAMGDETDALLRMAPPASTSRACRELDVLVTAGEHKAMALFVLALERQGFAAESFSGAQAGIETDGAHTAARVMRLQTERLERSLASCRVPVVGGAQGIAADGDVTFLGRGGTDMTAVALAQALAADACEIYTDVTGIMTADPNIVPRARLLPHISLAMLAAMCEHGCPKPAARAADLARRAGIALQIRSGFTFAPGTWVDETGPGDLDDPVLAVVSSAAAPGRHEASISLVGDGLAALGDPDARVQACTRRSGIRAEPVDSCEIRVTVAVPGDCADRAVAAIHDGLGLGETDGDAQEPMVAGEHCGR